EQCRRENTLGATVLAAACASYNIQLVTFSSDLVFDGEQTRPYVERDVPAPLNVYGKSKADAESQVLKLNPTALVIRTSAFFGPWDEYNFVTSVLHCLQRGERVEAAEDAVVSPTYVPDLVQTSLDLLIDGECGIWHLANVGAVSWAELARRVARRVKCNPDLVIGKPMRELGFARRPAYSVLTSERAYLMPTLENALERYFAERETRLESAKVGLPIEARVNT